MVVDPVLAAVGLGTSYPSERFSEVCLGSVPYEVTLELGEKRHIARVFDGYKKLPADNAVDPVRVDSEQYRPRKGAVVFKQGEVTHHRIEFVDPNFTSQKLTDITVQFYVDVSALGNVKVRRVVGANSVQVVSQRLPFNDLIAWTPHPVGRKHDKPLSERLHEHDPEEWR